MIAVSAGALISWISLRMGVIEISGGGAAILVFLVVGVGSGLLFGSLYRLAARRGRFTRIEPYWLATDIVLVSLVIAVSGGSESPWFIWYLGIAGCAAFATSGRVTVMVAGVSIVAYLTTLVAIGEVRGLDAAFWLAFNRIAFLCAASFFFLRATASLQEKQRLIRQLQDEQALKVRELMGLSEALSTANSRIAEADRTKSRFLANMSHELRTPLNAILGFSDILRGPAGGSPEKRERFLGNVHRSGRHLLGLINDILDLSKVEAGRMELHCETLDLGLLIEGVADVVRGTAAKAGVELSLEVGYLSSLPPMESDPVRLKQILYNLLSNAVKFSPEGSTVTVIAKGQAGDSVAIEVIDRGPGIPKEDQEKIFEPFRQSVGSHGREGTGLGLTLVRRLVDLLEGSITLESESGKGSVFRILLPLRLDQGKTEDSLPELPDSSDAAIRVLVIEDDLRAYRMMSRSLESAGYFPLRARDAADAVELASVLKPRAIALDLGKSGSSGWAMLEHLRTEPATLDIPVVIVSVSQERDLAFALRAEDYVAKPIEPDHLTRRLERLAPDRKSGRHLLLIDDDPALHELLDEILEPRGYRLEHAQSGPEGLELAIENPPDAIVLDLMMPGMSGLEVAAALRRESVTASIPILVLTAKDPTSKERQELERNIESLVQKGGDLTIELIAAVDGLWEESRKA